MIFYSASVRICLYTILLFVGAFSVVSCGKGGYSENKEERYKLREIEVGTSGVNGHETATLLLHCSEGDFYLTSSDIRMPSEIIDTFIWVLPMVADFKSQGLESCEVEVLFSQYHTRNRDDQSNPPQKTLWFRFKPHSKHSQQFWVHEFGRGVPSNFQGRYKQPVNVPFVFRDQHWIQTKPTKTW